MASRYTNTYSTSSPANTDKVGLGAGEMRNLKVDVQERMQTPPWALAYSLKAHGAVTAGTTSVSINDGDYHSLTLPITGTVTITIDDVPSNAYDEKVVSMLTIEVTNPASGAADVSFPASVKWAYGVEPTRDTTTSKTTVYQMTTSDAGTTWLASMVGTKFG